MIGDTGSADSTEALGVIAGELLGDFAGSELPETTDAPEAGTPPSPAVPDAPDLTIPDGDTPVEPEGTPSPDAPDGVASDIPESPMDPETAFATDPALTYTVNGVEKASDAIRVVDGAGYIPPSKLAEIQRKLGERDHYFDTNRQLYEKQRQIDAALSYTTGPKDKQQTLTGIDAFKQAAIDAASGTAAGLYMMEQFYKLFPNPTAEQAVGLQQIFGRASEIMENTVIREGQRFGQTMQTRSQAFAQQDTNAGLPTVDQKLTESLTAIKAWAKQAGKVLLDADFTEAEEIYGGVKSALSRMATAEDAQKYGVKVNTLLFDPTPLNTFFIRRADRNHANNVKAAADKTNQHRIAGAIPRKPVTSAAPRIKEQPVNQRAQDASDAWDLRERLALGRLTEAR